MSTDPARTIPRTTGGRGVTRFATRGEHRLSYETSGAADGTPILALHDLLADRGQLRSLAELLPGESFRLTLPDARGHGASPMVSGRAYASGELAADAVAVLDAEDLAAVHVAAVGWGAGIALWLALAAPERVSSLVLAEPYLPWVIEDGDLMKGLHEAADVAAKGQIERAFDLYLGMRLGPDWRAGLPKSRLGAMRRAAASLGPLLMGMTGAPPNRAALAQVEAPVAILLRENGQTVERETAEALASLLPNVRIEQMQHVDAMAPPLTEAWAARIAAALVAQSR